MVQCCDGRWHIFNACQIPGKLLIENVRVNKKLVENDKVTRDYLLRSETELSKFDQELQNAEKNKKIAAAYFNFLLNKSLADSVITEQAESFPLLSGITEKYTEGGARKQGGA